MTRTGNVTDMAKARLDAAYRLPYCDTATPRGMP